MNRKSYFKGTLFVAVILVICFSSYYQSSYANNEQLRQLDKTGKKFVEAAREPIAFLEMELDLLYYSQLQRAYELTDVKELEGNENINWIFKVPDISPIGSTVFSETGAILTPIIDVLIDLEPEEQTFKSFLYALGPDIVDQNKADWVCELEGYTVFPPVVSNKRIFAGTIDADFDINLDTNFALGVGEIKISNVRAKLFAISENGDKIWESPVAFDNELFLGPVIKVSDNLLLVTTVSSLKSEISLPFNRTEFEFNNFDCFLTGVDSTTGDIKWKIKAKDISKEPDTQGFVCFTVPDFNDDTIFTSSVNTSQIDEIIEFGTELKKEFDEKVFLLREEVVKIVPGLFNAFKNGDDTEPLITSLENEFESQLNEVFSELDRIEELVDTSVLYGIDENGNIKWQSDVSGISLYSVYNKDTGTINLAGFNVQTESTDLAVDVKIDARLITRRKMEISISFSLIINDLNKPVGEIKISVNPKRPAKKSVIVAIDLTFSFDDILSEYFSGFIASFSESDGKLLWTAGLDGLVIEPPIITSDGQKIVAHIKTKSQTSIITSVNASTGATEWNLDSFKKISSDILIGPNNSLFFVERLLEGGQKIWGVNIDGTLKWDNPFEIKDGILVSDNPKVSIDNQRIFFVMQEDITEAMWELITLDTSNGSINNKTEINKGVFLAPLVIDEERDTIFAVTSHNKLEEQLPSALPGVLSSMIHSIKIK